MGKPSVSFSVGVWSSERSEKKVRKRDYARWREKGRLRLDQNFASSLCVLDFAECWIADRFLKMFIYPYGSKFVAVSHHTLNVSINYLVKSLAPASSAFHPFGVDR